MTFNITFFGAAKNLLRYTAALAAAEARRGLNGQLHVTPGTYKFAPQAYLSVGSKYNVRESVKA